MQWIALHYAQVITAIMSLLSAAIAISVLIPGDQPEKTLQEVVNWIAKISVKPKE